MQPSEIRAARERLGLTLEALALMLGLEGNMRHHSMWNIENGRRNLTKPQERLLRAYLEGYRPKDWPQ